MSRTRTSTALRPLRRTAWLTVGLLTALAVPAAAQTAPGTKNPNNFELFALANPVEFYAASLAVPVVQEYSAGPYGASAAASSSGVVRADAGAPYSPFLFSLPGTATGATGGAVDVPTPPGYVVASFPTSPEAESEQGAYSLSATASAQSARGETSVRPPAAGDAVPESGYALATSSANADGSVTVRAVSRVDSFAFAGVELSRVEADYTLTLQPSGASTLKGQVRLGAVTAAGLTSGLTESGVVAAGMPLPVTRENLNTLAPALAAQGVTLNYAPTTFTYGDGSTSSGGDPVKGKTLQSVRFGGLVVGGKGEIPGQGPAELQVTLAALDLSATNLAVPEDAVPGTGSAPGDTITEPGGTGESGEVPTGSDVTGSGSTDVGTESSPVSPELPEELTPGTDATVPEPAALEPVPQTAGETAPVEQRAVRVNGEPAVSTESFYLVLVLAAAVALGSSQLVRFLAVRRAAGSTGLPARAGS